jgi:hypothetical protein
MSKIITITIDQKQVHFQDDSVKGAVLLASEFLVANYGTTSLTIDIIRRWKKNQFFFRTNFISSELTIN